MGASDKERVLREQYNEALKMAEDARRFCYGSDGRFRAILKGPNGEMRANPYVSEWYRAVSLSRRLAEELGEDSEGTNGPLLEAVQAGDSVEILQALMVVLADAIDHSSGHGLASLSRVLLDTEREIREINGNQTGSGIAGAIINRKANPNARRLSVV